MSVRNRLRRPERRFARVCKTGRKVMKNKGMVAGGGAPGLRERECYFGLVPRSFWPKQAKRLTSEKQGLFGKMDAGPAIVIFTLRNFTCFNLKTIFYGAAQKVQVRQSWVDGEKSDYQESERVRRGGRFWNSGQVLRAGVLWRLSATAAHESLSPEITGKYRWMMPERWVSGFEGCLARFRAFTAPPAASI